MALHMVTVNYKEDVVPNRMFFMLDFPELLREDRIKKLVIKAGGLSEDDVEDIQIVRE